MKRVLAILAALLVTASTWATPKGTVPRASAATYPLHGSAGQVSIGARLLNRNEVRKTFVSDVNSCCIVVEIAIYPDKAKPAEISLSDFVLRANGTNSATKPSSAKVVAASLQKNAQGDRDIAVYPTTGIGYESGGGYDPVTGARRASGVYTQAGVGVAIGAPGGPGASDKDRSVMETELSEKGLPEGSTSAPVSGYVYFPISSKKKGEYKLEYAVNGNKAILSLQVQ